MNKLDPNISTEETSYTSKNIESLGTASSEEKNKPVRKLYPDYKSFTKKGSKYYDSQDVQIETIVLNLK